MYRSVRLLAALGFVLSSAPDCGAAEFRSRPPHVHGLATVDIAAEGAILAITFRAPAINVVGFEHAPATSEERAALALANRTFGAGNRLFITPPAAGCRQRSATLTPIEYETDGDEKPNAPQADYEVVYRFDCTHGSELGWIDTTLFESLRNVRKITVNVLADRLQTQIELVPRERRVALWPE